MLPATVSKRVEALADISKQGKRTNGLFRLMESPDLWRQAYANIYPNKGATTPGVGPVTMDGFSMERAANIMELLKEDRYTFKPSRRVYIPKANGTQRPLGVPAGDDKLVQEVARMLLERIYEPVFSHDSHGFRPAHSCHTALRQIQRYWTGVKWLVEVDIQGFFDNIDHEYLVQMLEKKIDDKRFIKLIKAMLKAGYVEDWKVHKTYSGTPQGGVVSPILANIYLHELDSFMEDMQREVHQGKYRTHHREYGRYTDRIGDLRRTITWMREQGEKDSPAIQEMKQHIRVLDQARKVLPSVDPWDPRYRRLYYCRYADDFVMGIIGSKEDAKRVMNRVEGFITTNLNLRVAAEKSGIRHAKEGMRFLGYDIRSYSGNRVVKTKRGGTYTTFRSVSERMQLHVPRAKVQAFCQHRGYGDYDGLRAESRPPLIHRSNAEIILVYNAELRGFANYYGLALNAKAALKKLVHLGTVSLLKTLANKHRSSVRNISRQLRKGTDFVYQYEAGGRLRHLKVFALKDLKNPSGTQGFVDALPSTAMYVNSRTELVKRLDAVTCEYCGRQGGYQEVHHVRKLSDVKDGKEAWQRVMMAMQRKTIVLCVECHDLLHAGKLPNWRRNRMQVESRIC